MLSSMPFIATLPDELASKTASLVTVHGRYGNNALNGDWELGLTSNTSAPPQRQLNRTWNSGTSVPFTFTFTNTRSDAFTNLLDASFSIGGTSVQFDYGSQFASYEPNAIKIWARTSTANSGVTINDLQITTPGVSGTTMFPGTAIAVSQASGTVFREIVIAGIDFQSMSGGTVTLQGNVVMQFDKASAPRGSSLQFHVIAAHIPWVDLDVDSNNDGGIDPRNGRSGTDDRIEQQAGGGKQLVFGVPSDVTLAPEEPQDTAEIIVSATPSNLSNGKQLRITADGGLNIWLNKEKTQPLGSHNTDPKQPDVFTFDNATFTGEQRLYVDGNLEGIERAITLALIDASGAVISEDRILLSVEEYIDVRPIEKLAALNNELGVALAGDALQYLTAAEYSALKDAGLEVGRHDGLWDYVFLKLGNNYYTYIEPTLPGFSYKLFAVAPDTVSIRALRQGAEIANWLVGLGAIDVALSVIPGGTSAGYLEQGDYGRGALWFVADVGLTLSVVGKLGQVTAKAGSVVKSGTAVRLGTFLNNVGKVGQYRHVVLGGTIATGLLGAESGAGAVSDVLNGRYTDATIKGLDAVFTALGVSASGAQYRNALTDAARANKKLASKVDTQTVASKVAHAAEAVGEIAPDDWCFAPTTLVSTASGPRPIGEIEPSDEVWAFDFDTGEYVLARVLKRHNNVFEGNFVTITLSNGDTGRSHHISSADKHLKQVVLVPPG
jgi:hypothetical protein